MNGVRMEDLSRPVETIADMVRGGYCPPHWVSPRSIGMDEQGVLWVSLKGKVDHLPGLRKNVALAHLQPGGLRLARNQNVHRKRLQHLSCPVDESAWIKVQGTY